MDKDPEGVSGKPDLQDRERLVKAGNQAFEFPLWAGKAHSHDFRWAAKSWSRASGIQKGEESDSLFFLSFFFPLSL